MTKVSVVTICYNAVDVLEKTMLSVLNQTYENIEYIIIDGGSTDGSVDIVKKYQDRLAFWVSEPDKGIYDAMNKGIKVATGDWINFMNAGDWFYENSVIEKLYSNKSLSCPDVIYGYQIHVFSYGLFVRRKLPIDDFKYYMPIGHPASFVRTKLMKETPFDTSFRIAADYKFFYHLYIGGKVFEHRKVIVSVFDSTGISNTNRILTIRESTLVNGTYRDIKTYIKLLKAWVSDLIKIIITKVSPTTIEKITKAKRYKNPEYIELNKFLSQFCHE